MKHYIGITCGTFRDRDWSPPMNILRRTYIEAVATAGGAPFLIPLVDDEEVLRALYDRLDGLPRWAAADGKPILGICRGVQMLNVALGGTLYQDIPAQLHSDLVHDSSYTRQDWTYMAHDLRLAPDSKLAQLFETTSFPINSLHHQSLKTIAPGLRPVGWAPDGVVEAIEGNNGHFLIGVQCHPEALQGAADPRWQALFRRFVESCVPVTA